VQSSCLTFMHGDSQAVDRSLSSLRLAGNKISLSWFFFDKHDENAKDQLVLQIAFQGGGALTGDLFSYTTSQLTYGHRKGVAFCCFYSFLILTNMILIVAVFCKSLAGILMRTQNVNDFLRNLEPSSPKSLAQERQLRAQELVRAKNEEAAKKKVEEVKKVPFTPISQQGKATIEKKATLSPREVIADANRALLEGIKRKRLEKEEKKQLEQESQESSKPAAEQKKRKRRKSMEEDDDGKEEVVVQMPPASVWHSVWFKVLAVFLLATGGLGCLYMFCSGSSVSNHKKRY
jgi:hypothetical protein